MRVAHRTAALLPVLAFTALAPAYGGPQGEIAGLGTRAAGLYHQSQFANAPSGQSSNPFSRPSQAAKTTF